MTHDWMRIQKKIKLVEVITRISQNVQMFMEFLVVNNNKQIYPDFVQYVSQKWAESATGEYCAA